MLNIDVIHFNANISQKCKKNIVLTLRVQYSNSAYLFGILLSYKSPVIIILFLAADCGED